ncbi:MAG: hypothetical protein ABIB97_01390 [Patescibacteria group bacterium]
MESGVHKIGCWGICLLIIGAWAAGMLGMALSIKGAEGSRFIINSVFSFPLIVGLVLSFIMIKTKATIPYFVKTVVRVMVICFGFNLYYINCIV